MSQSETNEYQIDNYTIAVDCSGIEITFKEEILVFKEYFTQHYDVVDENLQKNGELIVIADQGIPEQELYRIQVSINKDNITCLVNDHLCHMYERLDDNVEEFKA